MTAPDDVRARFEAWADDQGYPMQRIDGGDYLDLRTEGVWWAWQAAQADLAGEVRAMRACAIKYLGWLDVADQGRALEEDMRNPEMCGEAALAKFTQEKP